MASSRSVSRYDDMDPPKPRNDAYTGLLTISFVAMFIGCLLLFIDFYSFDGMSPGKVKDKLSAIKGGERGKAGDAPAPKAGGADKDKPAPPEPKEVQKKDVKPPDPNDMKKDEKAPAPKEKKDDAKDMKKGDAKDMKKDDAKDKDMKKE